MISSIIVVMAITAANAQKSEIPGHGFVGIDHVGMNVPNIDSAVAFFSDVMSFVPVTTIGPLTLDDAWRKKYNMHPGAEVEKIVSMRAGNGANLELFQYKSPEANQKQPYNDDAGLNHFAVYTSDIYGSVKYLKSKGINVLNDAIVNSQGQTAGETWVYFVTPWGAKIELITYPEGKGYEKDQPAVKLWSPKDQSAKIQSAEKIEPAAAEIDKLIEGHLLIWNEKEGDARLRDLPSVYSPEVDMLAPGFSFHGFEQMSGFIETLHKQHPGYIFRHKKAIQNHHNIARMFWQFGTPSNPDAISGMDLFVIENGRVQTLYVFLDNPKK